MVWSVSFEKKKHYTSLVSEVPSKDNLVVIYLAWRPDNLRILEPQRDDTVQVHKVRKTKNALECSNTKGKIQQNIYAFLFHKTKTLNCIKPILVQVPLFLA